MESKEGEVLSLATATSVQSYKDEAVGGTAHHTHSVQGVKSRPSRHQKGCYTPTHSSTSRSDMSHLLVCASETIKNARTHTHRATASFTFSAPVSFMGVKRSGDIIPYSTTREEKMHAHIHTVGASFTVSTPVSFMGMFMSTCPGCVALFSGAQVQLH